MPLLQPLRDSVPGLSWNRSLIVLVVVAIHALLLSLLWQALHQPLSVVTAPIWNEQKAMVGGVQLPLPINAYDPKIPDQSLPAGSRYGFLSEDRILIWRNLDPDEKIGAQITSEAAQLMVTVRDGEFESVGTDGTPRYYSVAPMKEAGWIGGSATDTVASRPPGCTPIIAMMANVFAEDKASCLEAGMSDFLAKPFTPDEVFASLMRALDGREVAAANAANALKVYSDAHEAVNRARTPT